MELEHRLDDRSDSGGGDGHFFPVTCVCGGLFVRPRLVRVQVVPERIRFRNEQIFRGI